MSYTKVFCDPFKLWYLTLKEALTVISRFKLLIFVQLKTSICLKWKIFNKNGFFVFQHHLGQVAAVGAA